MEIKDYCTLFLADRMKDSTGFILGKRPSSSRWIDHEYLVAHEYDIEWRGAVRLSQNQSTDIPLAQPHPINVNWEDMPESFTRPEFADSDRSCGWIYCGPSYGSPL